MLKVKRKSYEFKPAPLVGFEGEGDERKAIYGEPYGLTLLLHGMATPEFIKLRALMKSDDADEQAYGVMKSVLHDCFDGWQGLTQSIVEEIIKGTIDQEVPEKHPIRTPDLAVSKENKAEMIDTLMLIAHENISFYNQLSTKLIELSVQKEQQAQTEKKT